MIAGLAVNRSGGLARQLRPFRCAQRLVARAGQCLDPALLIADLSAEGAFQDREFTRDLSNRSVRVDDSMRRLHVFPTIATSHGTKSGFRFFRITVGLVHDDGKREHHA